jgi:hypothetical protein
MNIIDMLARNNHWLREKVIDLYRIKYVLWQLTKSIVSIYKSVYLQRIY